MAMVHRPRNGWIRAYAAISVAVVAVAGSATACGRSSGDSGRPAQQRRIVVLVGKPHVLCSSWRLRHAEGRMRSGHCEGCDRARGDRYEIRIGVTADPGAAAAPGLEQEFFDTAEASSKWCNAAGGINGRKIVVDKLDAKLFDVGQVTTEACQRDFFLVGNGNAFDSAGVKIRERCKLGQIPAYVSRRRRSTRSTRCSRCPSRPTRSTTEPCGCSRGLPDTKTGGVGIGSSTLTSIIPAGLKAQEYLKESASRWPCCRTSRCRSTTTGHTSSS